VRASPVEDGPAEFDDHFAHVWIVWPAKHEDRGWLHLSVTSSAGPPPPCLRPTPLCIDVLCEWSVSLSYQLMLARWQRVRLVPMRFLATTDANRLSSTAGKPAHRMPSVERSPTPFQASARQAVAAGVSITVSKVVGGDVDG